MPAMQSSPKQEKKKPLGPKDVRSRMFSMHKPIGSVKWKLADTDTDIPHMSQSHQHHN